MKLREIDLADVGSLPGLLEGKPGSGLRQIFDLLPHGFFAMGADGRLRFTNRALARIYGTSVKSLEGRPAPQVSKTLGRCRRQTRQSQEMAQGQVLQVREEEWHSEGGERTYLKTSQLAFEVPSSGAHTTLGITVDITADKQRERERQRLQEELLKAQRLKSLGMLAGNISHDFNNILLAIVGNLDLALGELPPDASAREPLQEAVQASLRASELCRQTLTYSGRGGRQLAPVCLSSLAAEMGRFLEAAVEKNACLDVRVHPDLPPVLGDAVRLRQVLLNLITNASDSLAGQPGGIRISTYCQHASLQERNGAPPQVVLEVADTGVGIPPDRLERIFEPLFTTKVSGHGLGLASTREIVRSHRGKIQVESTLGKGTTFRIVLPAYQVGFPRPQLLSKRRGGRGRQSRG